MLVVRRRQGEVIRIGVEVELQLLSIGKSSVRLGINAPRSIIVAVCPANAPAAETGEKTVVDGRSAEMSGEV
jgi:carbon storage regulator